MAGKISKERTISGVVLVILALATILPGGPILAITLYIISNIAFLELTRLAAFIQERSPMHWRLQDFWQLQYIIC